MDHGIQEEAVSFLVDTCFIATIDAVAEIDTAPITSPRCWWSSIWIQPDSSRVIDGRHNDLRVGNPQQLKCSSASIDAHGRATSADTRTPHFDDGTSVDHNRYVLGNVKG